MTLLPITYNRIYQDLLEYKETLGNVVYRGCYTDIAIKHNVTRERVRQIAKRLGMIQPKYTETRRCKKCGKKFQTKTYSKIARCIEHAHRRRKELYESCTTRRFTYQKN